MDNQVKIISNNVRGLQSYQKRRKLFHHFNTSPEADIIMLQETHCTEKSENQWRAEWGGQAYFSHGTSEARGVCILVKNSIDFEMKNTTKDKEGRFLQISGKLQDQSISIANVSTRSREFQSPRGISSGIPSKFRG
jgi:exonuclease III